MLTSAIMLCVILCWRAPGWADVLAAVPGPTGPGHLPGGGHLPARSRHAVLLAVSPRPDAS